MRRTGVQGSIVTLLCDSGDRYGDTYYDDDWLKRSGIDLAPYTETLEGFAQSGRWREPVR
jgi:cysteine synthase A